MPGTAPDLGADDGFILVNDLRPHAKRRATTTSSHQRFSLATFVGVNFPLLERISPTPGDAKSVRPAGDSRGIPFAAVSARPVHVNDLHASIECFDDAAHESLQKSDNQARLLRQGGPFDCFRRTIRKRCVCSRPQTGVCSTKVSMLTPMRDPTRANLAKIRLA